MGLGPVSVFAAAEAGPFTVHFWAPMSKWLISGASFIDLNRPTDRVSVAQYSALTATGFFFSRYALLARPAIHSRTPTISKTSMFLGNTFGASFSS